MITICTRWESLQMPAAMEWRMWRQLKGAFQINRFCFTPVDFEMQYCTFEQYKTMQEALDSCQGRKIFLEPEGEHGLEAIAGIENPVFILGNTEHSNNNFVRPEEGDLAVRIKTPGKTDFYGINAASIALAYWYGQ